MRLKLLLFFLPVLILVSACAAPTAAPTATPSPSPTPIPATATLAPTATPDLPLTLTSAAFEAGGEIPAQYFYSMANNQCKGENISPELSWSGLPEGTQTLALTVVDPDGQNWVHWVQFNIPTDVTELPEANGGPEAGVKGKNSFFALGYGGPCPPGGSHHYVFTLYALDTMLALDEGASYGTVMAAMEGHVLEQVELVGMGTRQ